MTARATATEAQIRRAIAAARKTGLRVTGIQPDGTILVMDAPALAPDSQPAQNGEADRWRKVQA
jgi:hypothetical protein